MKKANETFIDVESEDVEMAANEAETGNLKMEVVQKESLLDKAKKHKKKIIAVAVTIAVGAVIAGLVKLGTGVIGVDDDDDLEEVIDSDADVVETA